MRDPLSSFLEVVGAAAVSAGVALAAGDAMGLIVAGAFLLVFGYRMGNP